VVVAAPSPLAVVILIVTTPRGSTRARAVSFTVLPTSALVPAGVLRVAAVAVGVVVLRIAVRVTSAGDCDRAANLHFIGAPGIVVQAESRSRAALPLRLVQPR
jgi:hypothetical protein